MTRLMTTISALLILSLSGPAFGQGVEDDPTGVEDMEPGEEQTNAAEARPAWLGIMMTESEDGVRIDTVVHGSPAASSGLVAGDLIRSIEETSVENADDVQEQVRAARPGESVSIEVMRDGESTAVRVELAAQPGLATILERHYVGRPAPSLQWTPVTSPDTTKRLSDIDKPVVVEFWATWCAPCKPMRTFLGELSNDVGGEVSFAALSAEELDRIAAHGVEENAKGRAYIPLGRVGEEALRAWVIEAYPTVFVIDGDGRVAGAFTGLESRESIGALVRQLAGDTEDDK